MVSHSAKAFMPKDGTVKLANRAPISWGLRMRRQPYLGVGSALKPQT